MKAWGTSWGKSWGSAWGALAAIFTASRMRTITVATEQRSLSVAASPTTTRPLS